MASGTDYVLFHMSIHHVAHLNTEYYMTILEMRDAGDVKSNFLPGSGFNSWISGKNRPILKENYA